MKEFRFATSILAALALFGGGALAQDKVVIRFWQHQTARVPSYEKEIALFEKANPNIKVEMTTTADPQYVQTLNLAMRSGNGPDVFRIPAVDRMPIKQVLDNGWMMPLDKYATPAWQKTFPKGSFQEGANIFKGKIYSAPFGGRDANFFVLHINNKVFRDAGLVDASGNVLVPKTWDEARQYAKQIHDRSGGKVYGYGFGAASGDFHLLMQTWGVRASGVPTIGGASNVDTGFNWKTGRYEFATNPAWRAWFNHLADMKADNSIYPQSSVITDDQARALFAAGNFGMHIGGSWVVNGLKSTNPDFTDYTIAPVPTRTGHAVGGFYYVDPSSETGRLFAISSKTQHPDAAWKFFAWLNSRKAGERWVGYGEALRIWPETLKASQGKSRELLEARLTNVKLAPNFMAIRPQLQDVKREPVNPNLPALILGVINGQIKRADIPAALKKLEDDANAELDRAIANAQQAGVKVTRDDYRFPDWNPLASQTTAKP